MNPINIGYIFDQDCYSMQYFHEQTLVEAENLINENHFEAANKVLEDIIVQVNPIPDQKIIEKAKYLLADLLYFRSAKEGNNVKRATDLYYEIVDYSKTEELVTKAKLALGIIFYKESSTEHDWQSAMYYFREIGNNFLADSEIRILANFHQAEMLRLGNESIPKNWKESARLYREVINQSPEKTFDIKFTLACMLTSSNYGIEPCIEESVSLFNDIIEKSRDVTLSNKAKYELAKIYMAFKKDLDNDFSKSTKLLNEIIISSDRDLDLIAVAKFSLIELYIFQNNFKSAYELISDFTSNKKLKISYILQAYQYKLQLLKPENCSQETFFNTLFKVYLLSDAEGRAFIEEKFNNSPFTKNNVDFLLAIETYYQAIDDFKQFPLESSLWPNCFGSLKNFFIGFSMTKNAEELEKMKAIILHLVKHDCPINDYIDPTLPIQDILAEFFITEANKLVPKFSQKEINVENAEFAIKLLSNVSIFAVYISKALNDLIQIKYHLELKQTKSRINAYNIVIPDIEKAQMFGSQLYSILREAQEWRTFAIQEQNLLNSQYPICIE